MISASITFLFIVISTQTLIWYADYIKGLGGKVPFSFTYNEFLIFRKYAPIPK